MFQRAEKLRKGKTTLRHVKLYFHAGSSRSIHRIDQFNYCTSLVQIYRITSETHIFNTTKYHGDLCVSPLKTNAN